METNKIVSVHIPKTGGVSFGVLLKKIYGLRCAYDYSRIPWFKKPVGQLGALKQALKRMHHLDFVKCIHGHFYADAFDDKYKDNVKYVTWLRDPVERLISLYEFWAYSSSPVLSSKFQAAFRKLTFDDFIKHQKLDFHVNNGQTRMLGQKSIDDFEFVGIQEKYEQGVNVFLKIMGLDDIQVEIPMRNVNKKRNIEKNNISKKQIERIVELNAKDIELYEKAKLRFLELERLYFPCTK